MGNFQLQIDALGFSTFLLQRKCEKLRQGMKKKYLTQNSSLAMVTYKWKTKYCAFNHEQDKIPR
jgi:hypothetical protein